MGITVAATGHRPDRLGGYEDDIRDRLRGLAKVELQVLNPTLVISGMALGWDQAVAEAALELHLPFDAYIPFVGQEEQWPRPSQAHYFDLLSCAARTKVCSPGQYAPWKMQKRNEEMVRASDILLALWNGSPGGTSNCIRYGDECGKPIVNCWPRWLML